MWVRATGRWAAGAVTAGGLLLAGCWKDNPAFFVTDGSMTGDDPGASGTPATSAPDEATTTSALTTDAEETGGSGSGATATTTMGVASSGGDETTTLAETSGETSWDTTGDTSGKGMTSGEPPPVCGAAGYGSVMMQAREWQGVLPQPCSDIQGRYFLVLGADQGMLLANACSPNPGAGCTNCPLGHTLTFRIEAPEPDVALGIGSCVYLAARGSLGAPMPTAPCRFQQMALWADQTEKPALSPPLLVLGHNTLGVDPKVAELSGSALSIVPVASGEPCECVDAEDCCSDKAIDYDLRFSADQEEVLVAPGSHAAMTFAGVSYEVYNGQSFETGACAQEQRFDWWLLRQ
jgi:hypothetical protein